ncbi:POTRA domain-containing protein [Gaetbulibacter saemankumensis]|uniref:POTRA domain-containing protein n=1 Tax=Gaetbulibacter saemankumensis TaxID=311208 RepID=UPI000684B578|nr:POTRA domain-containing protein [Gaetbulibacter saemankumensis]
MQRATLLYLIIYIFFSWSLASQNLSLNIKGDNKIETRTLDSIGYLSKHPNYQSISNELDSLQNRLYRIGYIENQINASQKVNDSTYEIQLQLKTLYKSIKIYYDNTILEPNILKLVSSHVTNSYFTLNLDRIETTLQLINTKISERGQPFNKISLFNIRTEPNQLLSAQLKIEQQPKQRQIDKIEILGYKKFPKSYIKHYLKLKPNQNFNLTELKKKTANLKNLRFANEVKPPEVLFSKDSTSIYLYIEKKQSNTFDGFLGFGTNETTNTIDFDGYLNLKLTNNLNFGEDFKLFYKSDENDQKTFETKLTLPYLFKSPIGLDLMLGIFRRDSSFTTTQQAAKTNYQINTQHQIHAGILATESNNLLKNNNTYIKDYKTSFLNFGYEFIQLNSFSLLFPLKSEIIFDGNIGKRTQAANKVNQTLFNLTASNIFNLNAKNSVYLKFASSLLNSENYLENELMRFGGINSIRGFEENSLLASFFSVLNTEYRYQLSNLIYIHSVIDLAYFENKITEIKNKLFGFGFGFGIYTKAGLFRLTYASGKDENTAFKLSNSKVHLSLTSTF